MTSSSQIFIIHRHGARYSLKPPIHNVVWPKDPHYWNHHVGQLTPVGVIQMCNLGQFFRQRYPWVDLDSVTVFSTHKSRAIESAWSFILGLLPDAPIKIHHVDSVSDTQSPSDVCCIHYYSKGQDPIFRFSKPKRSTLNVDAPTQDLCNRIVSESIEPHMVGTTLKGIFAQLQIDQQLQLPDHHSLIGHYDLKPEDIETVTTVGHGVIRGRTVPLSNKLADSNSIGQNGILATISDLIRQWNGENHLYEFSCHDTNIIAVMESMGLAVDPPDLSGYILIEQTQDTVGVYYCPTPFDQDATFDPKIWDPALNREKYINWDDLHTEFFSTKEFISMLNN